MGSAEISRAQTGSPPHNSQSRRGKPSRSETDRKLARAQVAAAELLWTFQNAETQAWVTEKTRRIAKETEINSLDMDMAAKMLLLYLQDWEKLCAVFVISNPDLKNCHDYARRFKDQMDETDLPKVIRIVKERESSGEYTKGGVN